MKLKRFSAKWRWALLLLVVALVAFRLALPTIVRNYVNNQLDELPEYDGHIGDVDIHLIRGAYSIDDVNVLKTSGEVSVPFFSAKQVDLSMQWSELFHGSLVGEIEVLRGKLNFIKAESEEQSQTSIDKSWVEIVKSLFPFRINRFAMNGGEIWFHDFKTEPQMDLFITNLVAVATNLTNARESTEALPAKVRVRGRTIGEGELELRVGLNPLAEKPTFDLNLAVTNMNLPSLNEMLEAYANVNVKRGTLDIFSEVGAKEGQFEGYVKLLVEDLDVFELKQDGKNPLKMIWQGLVAGITQIFKNHKEDQVATKIPISGSFENKTDVDIWVTVGNVLRNAFIEAFKPRLDNDIDLEKSSQRAEK
ncbi:MAG: DUF748 domain-containing protein [Verrucomicrobiota bacterium]|nr:DUF748 domain-containing protein [Verrucomicrobiota bacterium]